MLQKLRDIRLQMRTTRLWALLPSAKLIWCYEMYIQVAGEHFEHLFNIFNF